MRTNILKAGAAAVFLTLTTISEAMAACGFGGLICDDGGGGGAVSAPELDGPAGIAAIALLVGLVAVIYHRVRR
jgi:hypothetical protein